VERRNNAPRNPSAAVAPAPQKYYTNLREQQVSDHRYIEGYPGRLAYVSRSRGAQYTRPNLASKQHAGENADDADSRRAQVSEKIKGNGTAAAVTNEPNRVRRRRRPHAQGVR